MRSILTRIGKNIVDSKLKDNNGLKLYEEKSTASLKPTEPELRMKPPAVVPARISAGVGAQLGASKKPFFLGHADKGSTVFPGNSSEDEKNTSKDGSNAKPPYIPISVVTGGRDTTTVSPKLRAYILGGLPSATSAIPNEYADLANVMNKVGDVINFENWADLTAKQQLTIAQRAGLSEQDKQTLLNTSSHYVETIAKIQDVFENRYNLGITLADARNVAKELFDIANEREEATTRTGKYEQDAVFAPKALSWLDVEEKKILEDLTKNAGENDWDTEYTGGNPDLAARAARRATYADIDQGVASEQIEEAIMENVTHAKNLAAFSEHTVSNKVALMLWFYNNVKKDAPMDYKNPIIWEKSFPGLPYPEEDQVYNVFGIDISSSDLGNLNYAMIGKALGISEWLLLQQAGAANYRDHGDYNFIESQIESFNERDRGYGDQIDDQDMITTGFNIYDLLD